MQTVAMEYIKARDSPFVRSKRFGPAATNDKVLSSIIGSRTKDQMLSIRKAFEAKYGKGKSLVQWIKGETSGQYEDILVALGIMV